jgi:hypothetical protein
MTQSGRVERTEANNQTLCLFASWSPPFPLPPMGSVSFYELDIQGNVPGVLRDPVSLASLVDEFNTRQQVIDTRQSSRVSTRKVSNEDTSGTWQLYTSIFLA